VAFQEFLSMRPSDVAAAGWLAYHTSQNHNSNVFPLSNNRCHRSWVHSPERCRDIVPDISCTSILCSILPLIWGRFGVGLPWGPIKPQCHGTPCSTTYLIVRFMLLLKTCLMLPLKSCPKERSQDYLHMSRERLLTCLSRRPKIFRRFGQICNQPGLRSLP
jgi:hypothetical protein